MAKAWWAILAAALLLPLATVPRLAPGLGVATADHVWSLAGTFVLFGAGWRAERKSARRFAAMSVGLWTVLAIVSGFLILYLKPELKATGFKDWAKFWHVAWSWLALWAFALHLWIDRHGYMRAMRRTWSNRRQGVGFVALNIAVFVAIPVTWSRWGARVLQEPEFIPLTLWTALAVVAFSYGWWLLRRRMPVVSSRARVQTFVDVWLVPMTLWANFSGFPILFFATKETSLKYVAKYWHVWPSIIMAVLIFAHVAQFYRPMAKHIAKAP